MTLSLKLQESSPKCMGILKSTHLLGSLTQINCRQKAWVLVTSNIFCPVGFALLRNGVFFLPVSFLLKILRLLSDLRNEQKDRKKNKQKITYKHIFLLHFVGKEVFFDATSRICIWGATNMMHRTIMWRNYLMLWPMWWKRWKKPLPKPPRWVASEDGLAWGHIPYWLGIS